MATIRIETQRDAASGLVFAEVYTGDASTPVLTSEKLFSSDDDAVHQILDMCRTRWPDHTPFADDPTIGV